jgi:hypothetical protein
VHDALGLTRRQILETYKQMQLGVVFTVDENTFNGNLVKAPPFCSFPSQVEVYVDGEFHSFAGCACEGLAFPNMPHFKENEVRLESFCACCLEPITIRLNGWDILSCSPSPDVLVHMSLSPWDWNNYDVVAMCDSINFVIDLEHAERFERQVCRRSARLTLQQAQGFVSTVADQRCWDYHWAPQSINPAKLVERFRELGVDVSNWGG